MKKDPLQPLYFFDPEFARKIKARIDSFPDQPSPDAVALLVEETMWGLSQELSLGTVIAEGYTVLLQHSDPAQLDIYRTLVRKAEKDSGPTLARIMAQTLVPVLSTNDPALLEQVLKVVRIMQSKGVYTLAAPLGALTSLLGSGNLSEGKIFLDVLAEAFVQEMTYNQCKQVANLLAQFCRWLPEYKITRVMTALGRVIRQDVLLAEPFIDSLKGELGLLDHRGLSAFVAMGLAKYEKNPDAGEKFLSLKTQVALDACRELQLVVPLKQVRHRLNRYVQAATGLPLQVRPISSMIGGIPGKINGEDPEVISDGRYVYLPEEINVGCKDENQNLYKVLVRLEAGYYEFHTFEFDLQKALDQYRAKYRTKGRVPEIDPRLLGEERLELLKSKSLSDLELFFQLFPNPRSASDLFTVFEHGRIWARMHQTSPGVSKQAGPFLQQAYERRMPAAGPASVMLQLYAAIAIGPQTAKGDAQPTFPLVNRLSKRFFQTIEKDATVEAMAGLVLSSYHEVAPLLPRMEQGDAGYRSVVFPLGRCLRPELAAGIVFQKQQKAEQIRRVFQTNGIRMYRSEIQKKLEEQSGNLSLDDIKALVVQPEEAGLPSEKRIQNILIKLPGALSSDTSFLDGLILPEEGPYPSFRYHEWDLEHGDYLRDHVLVREKLMPEKPGTFYQDTVLLHQGLIRQIRHSFELLKPEGLSILRRWIEGDEFDYRSLLDFAIEKKIGLTPSERIYMKRIKQVRDVSVLVLVDLSRSTANPVAGTEKSVLTIEKEAIILLCEALTVVGDSFAIAGFSGTGRLGVDYFPIKAFDEGMQENVRQRIHAMQPLRSTRLGAAIRHASSKLEHRDSKVRLLLIVSDGFPNDNGYKQDYAIGDTRKALLEARSKNLFTHSITVNITGSSQLDHLYGKLHHSVISDVCDLPDRLLRIYGKLTG